MRTITHDEMSRQGHEPGQKTVQIVLAHALNLVRQAVRDSMDLRGVTVIGQAGDAREMVELVKELHPDVLITDLDLPGPGDESPLELAKNASPETKIIILTSHAEERCVTKGLDEGAAGYVLTSDPVDDLVRAVQEALEGHTFLSPDVSHVLLRSMYGQSQTDKDNLTNREKQVLKLVAGGLPSRDIADRLDISVKTVDSYRSKIRSKIGARSVADFVRYAIAQGMIEDQRREG